MSRRTFSSASPEARSPSSIMAGSPGTALTMRKTTNVSASRVGTAIKSRLRAIVRNIGSLFQPDFGEPAAARRIHHEVLDRGAHGQHLDRMGDGHERRVLVDDLLRLLVERDALFAVGLDLGLDEDLVELVALVEGDVLGRL